MLHVSQLGLSVRGHALVQDLSFGLAPGELLAVCGPNGAGKSTLLKLISGERRPTAGEISLFDRPLHDWRPRALAQRRAVVPQSSACDFPFCAWEVVMLGRTPHPSSTQDRQIALAELDAVGASHLTERLLPQLSGGERARVSLARAFAQLHGVEGPGLLLLDEPTAALDLQHQESVLSLLRRRCDERGDAVLIILHDLNLAGAWADRVLLMVEGRALADGPPEQVFTPPLIQRAYGLAVRRLHHPDTGRALLVPARADARSQTLTPIPNP
ncbi:heme ABC transporter ATP-binding protein [Myxococcota bacterium]|nr:heme ABC transporter ATP-binding protein [Myxococcota bacterium]